MIAPPTRVLFASTQGYDIFESFVSDIIYNTRLLKGCQYMTVTYVVVTPYLLQDMFLVVLVVDLLLLFFLDMDHNSYDMKLQLARPAVASSAIVPYDLHHEPYQYVLDEY